MVPSGNTDALGNRSQTAAPVPLDLFLLGGDAAAVLDMNPRDRYEVETKTVMDLAEYFPGGGTDFPKPLDDALDCLRQSRFKKGDLIFITDGECQVDPQWVETFRGEKEKLGFSLFSILIDMGPASLGTLKEFSDRISTIKQLTGEEAKEIFVKF